MTPSAEYTEYVLEHLESIGSVQLGRFFGGIGISRDSVQFAMIIGNSLYFVVDAESRVKYEQAGMRPFSYLKKTGRIQVHKYYEVPEGVLTDPEQLRCWANESMQVAEKTKPARTNKR